MTAPAATPDAFEEHRPALFGLAYRMLGSAADAEDIVQEAWLRWRDVLPGDVRSPRAYLVTATTRLCIDQLRSARARRETYVGPWLPEPLPSERCFPAGEPEATVAAVESIEFATMVLLERLGPVERAVFLLRDVFDYDYVEIAPVVGKTEAACRQVLHRARAHLKQGQARHRASRDEQLRLTGLFMAAASQGDLDGLIALFADDATVVSDGGGVARAALRPVHGAHNAARLCAGLAQKWPPTSVELVMVNGGVAILTRSTMDPHPTLLIVEPGEGRIANIYAVRNPAKLRAVVPVSSPGA